MKYIVSIIAAVLLTYINALIPMATHTITNGAIFNGSNSFIMNDNNNLYMVMDSSTYRIDRIAIQQPQSDGSFIVVGTIGIKALSMAQAATKLPAGYLIDGKIANSRLIILSASGWPCKSLYAWIMFDLSGKLEKSKCNIKNTPIPLNVLYTGFLVNFAMNFAIVISIWRAGAWLWGRYMRAHRICSTCGYSLVGLTTTRCPECGSLI